MSFIYCIKSISTLLLRREAAECVIEKYAGYMEPYEGYPEFYEMFCENENKVYPEYPIACKVNWTHHIYFLLFSVSCTVFVYL